MKIGNKLRGLRNEKGFSVATVAEQLCMSESTYRRRLETDKTFPSLEQLEKISMMYHIKFKSLLPPELLVAHKNQNGTEEKTSNSKLNKKLIKQYEARIEDLEKQLNFRSITSNS